jgi:hypothetical protein
VRELAVVAALYVAYSLARVFAGDDRGVALSNAANLLHLERLVGLDLELHWNSLLVTHDWLSTASAYWYASMHYVVTPVMLFLLWHQARPMYSRMRWALVFSTVLALTGYLLFPTAPPRMMVGYVDVMEQTAHVGWWGASASAPQGLGGLTNELAAMPSMHVGWAVWCSVALLIIGSRLWIRVAALAYSLMTVVVVVATANHWLVDAVAGALIVAFFVGLAFGVPWLRERRAAREELSTIEATPPASAPLEELPPAKETAADGDVALQRV